MQLRGGRWSDSREEEAEDVDKERAPSDKEDVAAFVSLLSSGWTIGSFDQTHARAHFSHTFSAACEMKSMHYWSENENWSLRPKQAFMLAKHIYNDPFKVLESICLSVRYTYVSTTTTKTTSL